MSAARATLKTIETDIARAINLAILAGKADPRYRAKVWTGNSLFLEVRGGSASSLGTYPDVTLYGARQARNRLAATRREGRTESRTLSLATTFKTEVPAKRARFADMVEMFIANSPMAAKWKGDGTARKYRLLKDGALGKLWTDEIDKLDVRDELQKRWGHTLVGADKNRIRIKQICDYARSSGYRPENAINPANNDDMKNLIAKPAKSVPHPALPLQDIPAFMGKLATDGSQSAKALAFAIHVAARTDEARLVDWSEVRGNVLTLPASRMKEGKEHSCPLSLQALALLGTRGKGRIFPDVGKGGLLDRVKEHAGAYTTHGFRSVFNDWAKKQGFSKELRDLAMAHITGTTTDQAYNRDPLIEERREMMKLWSGYLAG
jgi:integrase